MNNNWHVVCVCAASAWATSSAMAVPQSTLKWEASSDSGATWHSSVDVTPGSSVSFRLSVSLINNTGVGSVPSGGVLGFNTLPRLSEWTGGDVVQPFAAELWYEGSSVNPVPRPLPGPYPRPSGTFHGSGAVNGGNGRQAPFGANGVNGNGVPVPRVVGTELQLVAEVISFSGVSFSQLPAGFSQVYAWDGHRYLSTFNGEIGIDPPAAEIDAGLWAEYDDYAGSFFRPGVTNVTVFRYGITLDANDTSDRLLVQTSSDPAQVYYAPAIGSTPTGRTLPPNNIVIPASVHVVPTPMGTTVLLLAAFGVVRRRRGR